MLTIIQILQVLLHLLRWIIVIQVILSLLISFNVINTYNEFVRSVDNGLTRLTEPLYRPIRRVLPDFGALDLAPFVVLIALSILDLILNNLANSIATGAPF